MKKRKMRLKTKLIIIISIAAAIALAALFFNNATAVILSVSSARLKAMNTLAVDEAVGEALQSGAEYGDFMTVSYGDDGNVSSMTANSAAINSVARRAASLAQTKLTQMSGGGISIPLGAFTGIEALSGFGAGINIKIIPVIWVECSFVSRFTQAGINQTIHSIYIEVVTDITIVLAARTERVLAASEILVCESLINGEIPQIYLQGGLLGSGSLVPAG